MTYLAQQRAGIEVRLARTVELFVQGLEVSEMAAILKVSRATIRHDLTKLRKQSRIGRRPGGTGNPLGTKLAWDRAGKPRGDEAAFQAALAGRRFENVPYAERPFVTVERPGLAIGRGTTASQCAEQGASGGWGWRASAMTYGKGGAP